MSLKSRGEYLLAGQFIEVCGKQIQQYGQEEQVYAELLQTEGPHSTRVYDYIVKTRIEAIRMHYKATKIYTQVVQEILKEHCKTP
ncbi:MAG: hypothetical protein SAK29_18985 [Scytonema sp. PMC 1069.18]|nr:hypothetical protein [Scytonema sp. PMC 1069.18]MEC4883468.1 hypothetical protein [Scytonema sp. PMC 1070.18]